MTHEQNSTAGDASRGLDPVTTGSTTYRHSEVAATSEANIESEEETYVFFCRHCRKFIEVVVGTGVNRCETCFWRPGDC